MLKIYCDICNAECIAGVTRFGGNFIALREPITVPAEYGSTKKEKGSLVIGLHIRVDSGPQWALGNVPDICDKCATGLIAKLKIE